MKKMFIAATMLAAVLVANASAQGWQNGWVSRYWDGCKPSCSWTDNANRGTGILAKACSRANVELGSSTAGARSSCDAGGSAYTCFDQIPFVDPGDPNVAYAFAATPGGSNSCGKCYELEFTGGFQHGTPYATHQAISGRRLIVMASNIGYDVAGGQFDVMIPGGGLGAFDSFSEQIGHSSSLNAFPSSLGQRYGGFLADCENELRWGNGTLAQYQTCLRNKCDAAFTGTAQAQLREGCRFYADWFMAANNPQVRWREVACPAILANRYGVGSGGSVPTPGGGGGTPTNRTLTINRVPGTGGSVTVNGAAYTTPTTHANNAQVTLVATPASGFTFNNWTGTGAPTPATNATGTVTMSADRTITANFTAVTTRTLTIVRSPNNQAGSVTVNGATYVNPTTHNDGTQVTVVATPAQGFTFVNWTGQGAPQGTAASNPTATIIMSANRTITANFQAATTTPQTYTLTVNRLPNTQAGSVTVNGAPLAGVTTHNEGTTVTLVAAANTGFRFVNWTGTGAPTGANATNATATITMSANRTITANFVRTFTLTVNRDPATSGSVTVNGAAHTSAVTLDSNVQVTVVATPSGTNTFANWLTLPTGATATGSTVTFNIRANQVITAVFQAGGTTPETHTLNVTRLPNNQAGTVAVVVGTTTITQNPSTHNAGTAVTLTANPSSGYEFDGWTGGGIPAWTAGNASVTVTMSVDRAPVANFRQIGGGSACEVETSECLTLTRTVLVNNAVNNAAGRINVEPDRASYRQSEILEVSAVANAGFEFDRWEGDDLAGSNPAGGTTNMWWTREIRAHFRPSSGNGNGGDPTTRTDTIKVEAEDFVSSVGDNIVITQNPNGVTNIGFIVSGNSTTYIVDIPAAGAGPRTMEFMLATNMNSSFQVWVNGAQAGTIIQNSTGSWDTYQIARLSQDVTLVPGSNTIELRFETAVNVDYFLLLGEVYSTSVNRGTTASRTANLARTHVTLRPAPRGFQASLQTGHSYTSYRLIDLRGREIQSGLIGEGVTELRFNNIRSGMLFLRLEGNDVAPKVLRAVVN
jgi:hypothetical protein